MSVVYWETKITTKKKIKVKVHSTEEKPTPASSELNKARFLISLSCLHNILNYEIRKKNYPFIIQNTKKNYSLIESV